MSEPSEWVSERVSVNYLGMDVMSSSCLLRLRPSPEPQTIALNFDDGTQALKKKASAVLLLLVSSCTAGNNVVQHVTPNNTGTCVTGAKNGTERSREYRTEQPADTIRTLQATTREVWSDDTAEAEVVREWVSEWVSEWVLH
jgi:hypothetical protein